ncbi:ABC-2 family transporter protein [Candidatus Daviesbacteria bacterium]|nr:ABC-2 family transporter protein [Candidatus Daviesbacteria bacterium]
MKELKIWLLYTGNSFQQTLSNRALVLIFMTGKSLRIILFTIFLIFLFNGAKSIAGYNRDQIIFFYLTFNLIDTLAQLLFREVYRFRQLVVSGNLDFVLLKPVNPLIRVLLGGGDVLDLMLLIAITLITIWFGYTHISSNLIHWLLFIALIVNSLLIAAAFHIWVLGIGIMTTTVDHLIMVYRDLSSMLRIPVDLYIEPIRAILTFLIPLGIMLTFPAKVLMGLLSPSLILLSLLIATVSFLLSLKFWDHSLKQYSSASS